MKNIYKEIQESGINLSLSELIGLGLDIDFCYNSFSWIPTRGDLMVEEKLYITPEEDFKSYTLLDIYLDILRDGNIITSGSVEYHLSSLPSFDDYKEYPNQMGYSSWKSSYCKDIRLISGTFWQLCFATGNLKLSDNFLDRNINSLDGWWYDILINRVVSLNFILRHFKENLVPNYFILENYRFPDKFIMNNFDLTKKEVVDDLIKTQKNIGSDLLMKLLGLINPDEIMEIIKYQKLPKEYLLSNNGLYLPSEVWVYISKTYSDLEYDFWLDPTIIKYISRLGDPKILYNIENFQLKDAPSLIIKKFNKKYKSPNSLYMI